MKDPQALCKLHEAGTQGFTEWSLPGSYIFQLITNTESEATQLVSEYVEAIHHLLEASEPLWWGGVSGCCQGGASKVHQATAGYDLPGGWRVFTATVVPVVCWKIALSLNALHSVSFCVSLTPLELLEFFEGFLKKVTTRAQTGCHWQSL